MTPRRWIILGIALVLLAAGFAAARLLLHPSRIDGKTAQDWLTQAVQAAQAVTFEAQGTVRDGALNATFTEVRAVNGALRLTYTDPAHAGAYMTVHDGAVTICDHAGAVTHADAAPALPAPCCLTQYNLRLDGATTVAGRRAVVVLVRDRQSRALLARYVLDRENAVPLQTITYHPRNGGARETTYTQITYRHVCRREIRQGNATPASPPLTLADAEAHAGFHWLAPSWLPEGFAPAAYRDAPCPCKCNGRTIQVTYRDGLRSFMVAEKVESVSHASHGCGMSGGGHHCGTGGCAHCSAGGAPVITRKLSDRTVIVVGEIPPETLQRVADSITP